MEMIPDSVDFIDEQDDPLDWPEWHLTTEQKVLIAECMVKWHQSFEVTVARMLRSGLTSVLRKRDPLADKTLARVSA